MSEIVEKSGLNDVQLGLLRMFNRKMSYDESVEVRDLLFNFYSNKVFDEVDKIVEQKGITEADYEKLRSQDQRTVN
ncbi:MAG: hypothetical protein MUF45_06145 [Spirosomaceae bacterium]|jgi:hypothetical protein|nr:hypothetical protein [Spirosomataceae bacterium]